MLLWKVGRERKRLHLNERAQPALCIAADVRLGEWRDFIRASSTSFSSPVPDWLLLFCYSSFLLRSARAFKGAGIEERDWLILRRGVNYIKKLTTKSACWLYLSVFIVKLILSFINGDNWTEGFKKTSNFSQILWFIKCFDDCSNMLNLLYILHKHLP